jgi:hypothetical protein
MKLRKGIFNKYLFLTLSLLFLITVVIKVHSIISFPKIKSYNFQQISKIDKSRDEFSFVVFGDNKNSITTFKKLIEMVNIESPLFSIDVGDLVQDGEKEKFRFFLKQIMEFKNPFLTVIGNHELRENGRANYYKFFGPFYYSFNVGKTYFIILDDANEENLEPWQMNWLKDELEKSKNYKYRFIFMHVPLFDPRKHIRHCLKDINFAERLNSLFDKYNITMLFASHIHAYYKGRWGKTPYIITGGGGADMDGLDPNHYFYHYIKVNISDNGINYEVKKIKSFGHGILGMLLSNPLIYLYAFIAIHYLDIIIIIFLLYSGLYLVRCLIK